MKKNAMGFALRNGLFLGLIIYLLILPLAIDCRAADPADRYPSRPIEFVLHVGPGSSSDRFARVLGDIIQKEKILSQPTVIVNKQGGGAAAAMGYLYEKKADPHVVMIVSSVYITTPILEALPYNYKTFTPIANLCYDASMLVVRSDSPFKTIDDLIAEARKRPKDLIQGCSSLSGYESLMGRVIQMETGVQWNTIPFRGGQSLVNLLGGNVDFIFESPVDISEHVRAGKIRPLLSGSLTRFSEFKDVPTMEEKGLGKGIPSYRGVVGPPDMPEYAVKKLVAAFKKVTESERFQKYLDGTAGKLLYLGPAEYIKLQEELTNQQQGLLSEMDLIKKKK